MLTLWQQILIAVISGLVGGLAGGGIISAILDVIRFRREQEEVEREEQRIAIDPINARISIQRWAVKDNMSDKFKLYVYENALQDTLLEYAIIAEFLIRNLRNEEIIITSIDVEEPGLPPLPLDEYFSGGERPLEQHTTEITINGNVYLRPENVAYPVYDLQGWYDLKTRAEKDRNDIQNFKLGPKETLPLVYVAVRRFCAIRKLETPPDQITVTIHSTGGHKVSKSLELTKGSITRFLNLIGSYNAPDGSVEQDFAEEKKKEWKKAQKEEEEEEIPF
jgi:hypothetical protein